MKTMTGSTFIAVLLGLMLLVALAANHSLKSQLHAAEVLTPQQKEQVVKEYLFSGGEQQRINWSKLCAK